MKFWRARKPFVLAALLGALAANPAFCGPSAHNDPARAVPLNGTPAPGMPAHLPPAQPGSTPDISLPPTALPGAVTPANVSAEPAAPSAPEAPAALNEAKAAAPTQADKSIPAVQGHPVLNLPAGPAPRSRPSRGPDGLTLNDDGVPVWGRAEAYWEEVQRMAALLQARGVDLSESLNVMDDAYALAWAKLTAMEHFSRGHGIDKHAVHLNRTLQWIDAVLRRPGGRPKALLTHQVFFHHADNPISEIEEGIRRVDGYLKDIGYHFNRQKKATREFDQVILVFDTRGYAEIKSHIQERAKAFGPRFKFAYVDEIAQTPKDSQQIRREFTDIIRRNKDRRFRDVAEGVVYSRYVGLLLELKTLEYFTDRGYKILQSGHEVFDETGRYKSELDAVVQDPNGEVALVEAKSARVPLTISYALQNKFLYKLAAYQRDKALLEKAIGHEFSTVFFTVDAGKNENLRRSLNQKAEELSKEYGFNIRFVFIESHP